MRTWLFRAVCEARAVHALFTQLRPLIGLVCILVVERDLLPLSQPRLANRAMQGKGGPVSLFVMMGASDGGRERKRKTRTLWRWGGLQGQIRHTHTHTHAHAHTHTYTHTHTHTNTHTHTQAHTHTHRHTHTHLRSGSLGGICACSLRLPRAFPLLPAGQQIVHALLMLANAFFRSLLKLRHRLALALLVVVLIKRGRQQRGIKLLCTQKLLSCNSSSSSSSSSSSNSNSNSNSRFRICMQVSEPKQNACRTHTQPTALQVRAAALPTPTWTLRAASFCASATPVLSPLPPPSSPPPSPTSPPSRCWRLYCATLALARAR